MKLMTVLLILNLITSKRTNADVQPSCSKKPRRFIATEGHALVGHVISTHMVNLYPDCHDLCLKVPRCSSYNFEYKSTSSSHVCEINDATENMCAGSLVRKPGFKYYEEVDPESKCARPYSPSSDADETSFQVTFPEKSVTDYIRLDLPCLLGCVPRVTALTICYWLKTDQTHGKGTIFSYAVADNANEIFLFHNFGQSKMKFHIAGHERELEVVNLNDNHWHHICATWENAAGSWNLYIDGTLSTNSDNLMTGHVVDNNGIVILGQDQDNLGGGFAQFQSFHDHMYGVNMWNKVLTAQEILHMTGNCSYGVGNYLKWRDFLTGLHGNVAKTSPATCLP